MASNSVGTGAAGQLVLIGTEVGYNAAANWHDISWALYLNESTEYNFSFSSASAYMNWAANGGGQSTFWSGGFSFDWRGGGLQSTLIASGTFRYSGLPDGTSNVYLEGHIGDTGTSGAGGPAGVGLWVPVTTLKVAPNKPTGITGTRVSDTQGTVSWANSGASNGQPVSNQIYSSINGSAFTKILDISATGSTNVTLAANKKYAFQVSAWNSAGFNAGGPGGPSAPIYTTPAAPTGVVATKQTNLDIKIDWTPNVAYSEHVHEVWHGTVTGGVTTWDGAALASVASGTTTYLHTAPDPSFVHVYQVRAKTSSGTALYSTYALSNTVQLLVAPNKPTIPSLGPYADRAQSLVINWIHNSVDTSPQSAYEFSYSTDGGVSWTSTNKVVSTQSNATINPNVFPANTVLTVKVRTWGAATTGGSDGTGASAWSDLSTVTYKTAPVGTVVAPANGSALNDASLKVTLGFSQAESATFVKATIQLKQGATLLESTDTTTLVNTQMTTPVLNGQSYTVTARVQDSNGLWSSWVSSTFSVTYLPPVPAGVNLTYLPDNGFGQVTVTIAAPGVGQSVATTITILRSIDGGPAETLVMAYPVDAEMTILDTTATIHGTNTYTIITTSALGAQTTVVRDLVTTECRKAFLSKGTSFSQIVSFGGNHSVSESLSVASATMEAAGRIKPIGMYGTETNVQLKVSSFVFPGFGSTVPELRSFLLVPGQACYRDASGRRVFGTVKGSVAYKKSDRGDLSFTMTETSGGGYNA